MEKYADLAVFSEKRFEELEVANIEVVKYGEVELDSDEEEAMKLHPKMAMPRRLEEGYLGAAIDTSYTKVRWQLKKEEENEGTEKSVDKEKSEEIEMEEARTRLVNDSVGRVYDERRQRVTDLKECTRIFLPNSLDVKREAQLEMRKETHTRISEEYRRMNCDEKGRQENNLTREQQRGLKKLEKRKNNGEIAIIMTDKSSKMCVMRRDDYLKLGEDHVNKEG